MVPHLHLQVGLNVPDGAVSLCGLGSIWRNSGWKRTSSVCKRLLLGQDRHIVVRDRPVIGHCEADYFGRRVEAPERAGGRGHLTKLPASGPSCHLL